MNVTGTLGGVSGGVSRQPDILRYPGQCAEQTNMLIDPVNGIRRRKGLQLIELLDTDIKDRDVFVHEFSLKGEDYVAIFDVTGVEVYGIDGTHYTTVAASYSYLNSTTFLPSNMSSVQVGEYNLIANSSITVKMSDEIEADEDQFIAFHINDGMNWGVEYYIKYDSVIKASYTAPPGDVIDSSTTAQITSTAIAAGLVTALDAFASPLGWTVIQDGNTIMMRRLEADIVAGADPQLFSMEDSFGSKYSTCIIGDIQTLDELPPRAYPGHWLRVRGKESSSLDDFYMIYETTDGTINSEGIWKETHKPTEVSKMDESTMPHALIRVEDGTFYFTPLDGSTYGGSQIDEYAGRASGDSESKPAPAFVDSEIRDMTIVQERLVMVSEDHINFSKTQREFTFWDASALSDVDTDPIELVTPGDRAANLYAAIEHDQNLAVLGDKKQFAVPLKQALTKANASFVPTTSYDVDQGCRPCTAGRGLFFAFTNEERSGVREYRLGDTDTVHLADDITSYIDDYLPKDLRYLVPDTQNSMIFAIPEYNTSNKVPVFQYLDRNGQHVMASWMEIEIEDIGILYAWSINGDTYFIGQSAVSGIGLYKLSLTAELYMDFPYSAVVSAGELDVSLWAFKDVPEARLKAIVTTGTYAGMEIQIESSVGGTVTLHEPDMWEGETVSVGVQYESRYTPTMPVLRDKDGKAIQVDRLRVGYLLMDVYDSGGFIATVSAPYYDDTEQIFTGRFVGSSFVVGEPVTSSRIEMIAVGHDARQVDVTITTDSVSDLIIQAIEYKGSYTRRGARLT